MEDTLFDTEEKRQLAVANFKSLLLHPGWMLLKQINDANIQLLQEEILDGFEGETQDEIKFARRQLKLLKEFTGMPQKTINEFSPKDSTEPNMDPFDTVDDIKARRSKEN